MSVEKKNRDVTFLLEKNPISILKFRKFWFNFPICRRDFFIPLALLWGPALATTTKRGMLSYLSLLKKLYLKYEYRR